VVRDRSQAVRQSIKGGKAKNVIMFLGDGMGDSEITIARNDAVGAAGRVAMDVMRLTGEDTTYAVQRGTAADVPAAEAPANLQTLFKHGARPSIMLAR
jgi:alkaline phosphatase